MYQKILVPLDGSELSECVFPHLKTITKGTQVQTIIFLRVVEPLDLHEGLHHAIPKRERQKIESRSINIAREELQNVVNRYGYEGADVSQEIIAGKVTESIIEYANNNEVELIVIATHGRSGIKRWTLGSVADKTLHSSCVPVLMVRAPGCEIKI